MLAAPLARHLDYDFQLDRGAEREACDAIHRAAGALLFSEDLLQQLGGGVGDFRLIAFADSSCKCNKWSFEEYLIRRFIAQCFSGTIVKPFNYFGDLPVSDL